MKCVAITILLTFSFSLLTAQKYGQARIDSLLTVLKNDNAYRLETGKHSLPEDTNKINLLLNLSLNYSNLNNTDDGMKYANEGYLLAKKLG